MPSRLQDFILSVEGAEDSAGGVAFQAPSDLSIGFLFGLSFFHVGAGFFIMSYFGGGNHVQGTVECAVAAAVELMSDCVS